MLDPNPENILGKGILPPEKEAKIIARGCVFAKFVTAQGKSILVTFRRPHDEILADLFSDTYAPAYIA